MPARKRRLDEVETEEPPPRSPGLTKLRNTWEFANLMQYISIFGAALKIDRSIEIEDLEYECLKPEPSKVLADIGLCLLKNVSSHPKLTLDNFDEYTRRQYAAKLPNQENPFGEEDDVKSFMNFNNLKKLRVLVQLSRWTLINATAIREKTGASDQEQCRIWRMDPIGFDRHGRPHYVFDDNRLYRKTNAPLPPAKSKDKSKRKSKVKPKPRAGTRSSKRRKLSEAQEVSDDQEAGEVEDAVANGDEPSTEEDTFGGMKWECIAITTEEYRSFLTTLSRKDPVEKKLYKIIVDDVLQWVMDREEEMQRRAAQKQKELLTRDKMLHAKRSSRIAGRQEKERQDAEAEAAERKRQQELIDAQKLMARQEKMAEDRQSRMLTREQRENEKRAKRALEEEELRRLTEMAEKSEEPESQAEGRQSKRQLEVQIIRKRKAVEELEEEEWFFDCSGCGVRGENIDDGEHSVACERCNVWQHSSCLGIAKEDAEQENFDFICSDCQRKEEEAKRPKPPPIRVRLGPSSSPPSNQTIHLATDTIEVQVPVKKPAPPPPPTTTTTTNAHTPTPAHTTTPNGTATNGVAASNGTSITVAVPKSALPPAGKFFNAPVLPPTPAKAPSTNGY